MAAKRRAICVIGLALELDRADKIAAGAGGEPALDQCQEPRRIADDIGKQPVDRPDRARVERKGAVEPMLDARQARDPGGERRLVDADHSRAHLLQRPAPAAGAAAEIEADLPCPGPSADQGQRLPQFQIGAARRPGMVLDKADLAVRKRARAMRRREHRRRRRARSTSRAAPSAAASRKPAAWPRLWAAVPGSASRAGAEPAHRPPNCAGSRAISPPHRRSTDRDLLRVEPDIGRPRRRTRRPGGDQQPAVGALDRAQLRGEFVDISVGGEIGGANHVVSITCRGAARHVGSRSRGQ